MKHQKLETLPEISKRMSNVKLKSGVAESMLAKTLWHRGVRYRLNCRTLPGSPDIAITKYKIAVFIDGEFWHGQDWENKKKRLKRNREYWIEKIEENMARDKRNDAVLKETGWTVIHFWEKDVLKNLNVCIDTIIDLIQPYSGVDILPKSASETHLSLVAEPIVSYDVSNIKDS